MANGHSGLGVYSGFQSHILHGVIDPTPSWFYKLLVSKYTLDESCFLCGRSRCAGIICSWWGGEAQKNVDMPSDSRDGGAQASGI